MALHHMVNCGRPCFFHILCMIIVWYTRVYLFQNNMVFTTEYDGIFSQGMHCNAVD